MDPTDCFASSYATARARFLAAAADAGAELASYRHPLAGPAGEPLFLDVARVGAAAAHHVLFVTSGTHGIEGFCGSGIQTFLLRDGIAERLPADTALVLVHAVNPWGFAWQRRVNEDNVDLNRNFSVPGATLPDNPDYAALHPVLTANPLDLDAAVAAAAELERVRGQAAAYRALSGGQFGHPDGIQFGGRHTTWSNRTLRRIWARHGARADAVALVDLHSGLGPRGVGLLLQTAADDSAAATLASAWWPDTIRVTPASGDDAMLATGLIGPAFVTAHAGTPAVGVVLEFGTHPMSTVMRAVLEDHWLDRHGDRGTPAGRAIVGRMREAFFLDDPEWQGGVCARAADVVTRGLDGLAGVQPVPARIRHACADDAATLVGFAVAMARETEDHALDVTTVEAGVARLLADPELGRVYVVEEAGKVVATLMLTYEWSDWRDGCFWWIQSVYVVPGQRRRGLYRRLYEHVHALAAADPGVCGIRLYVERENDGARATYVALGMRETGYRLLEALTRGR